MWTQRAAALAVSLAATLLALAVSWAGLSAAAGAAGAPTAPRVPATGLRPSGTLTAVAYLPIIWRSDNVFAVNPQSRQASLDFYNRYYVPAGPPPNWTGTQNPCNPGATDAAFRDAVLLRINYFRAMAGVSATVTFSGTFNQKAQASALMMSANISLSHAPPVWWTCYTAAGAEAAGSSNLALGAYGWDAMSLYMKDPGSGNTAAGHRRWILYPQTREMGTGDIPGGTTANDLWVFDGRYGSPRPATREEYVAWPPPGYVPYTVVYPRWSFAYGGANFSGATVQMTSNGSGVSLAQSAVANGYGENTLVWIPLGLNSSASWTVPLTDTTYVVNVQNVLVNSVSRSFSYSVTVFNPGP
ncbi:MAG: CAP domain-containing protein [Chloroflexi bacterium]|nr:CAP domain-containing protein [Chloroflexota bacterium]